MEKGVSSHHVAKDALRKLVRRRIEAMSPTQRLEESNFVARKLLSLSEVKGASSVAVYVPLPDRELDIGRATAELKSLGKKLLLPRIGEDDVMRFVEFDDNSKLEKHSIGFLQPDASAAEVLPDVIVCPGRAFDVNGHRVGFGKGYYDRALARLVGKPPVTIGVCFGCQLYDDVPHEDHDQVMTKVLAHRE
jgi:5-formyltetrahydrofolate cyclo-ligase